MEIFFTLPIGIRFLANFIRKPHKFHIIIVFFYLLSIELCLVIKRSYRELCRTYCCPKLASFYLNYNIYLYQTSVSL